MLGARRSIRVGMARMRTPREMRGSRPGRARWKSLRTTAAAPPRRRKLSARIGADSGSGFLGSCRRPADCGAAGRRPSPATWRPMAVSGSATRGPGPTTGSGDALDATDPDLVLHHLKQHHIDDQAQRLKAGEHGPGRRCWLPKMWKTPRGIQLPQASAPSAPLQARRPDPRRALLTAIQARMPDRVADRPHVRPNPGARGAGPHPTGPNRVIPADGHSDGPVAPPRPPSRTSPIDPTDCGR